jgi:hypothetical protein
MTISTINELLMRERQQRLAEEAERYRQVHQYSVAPRAPLRAGVGRFLVRTGQRLAQQDGAYQSPTTLATN